MALKNQVSNVYGVGLRNVGSYQVSGHAWVTGSTIALGTDTHTIEFPYVTKNIIVQNTRTSGTKHIRVHFADPAQQSSISHFITVKVGQKVTLDVKCAKIYLTGHDSSINSYRYEVYASLTEIPAQRMYELTGSGISE
jgi:hypothetical protein